MQQHNCNSKLNRAEDFNNKNILFFYFMLVVSFNVVILKGLSTFLNLGNTKRSISLCKPSFFVVLFVFV